MLKNRVQDNSAIVLFSGGQDSTICLFWAKKRFSNITALSFDYNQHNIIELEYAARICQELKQHHITLKLDTFRKIDEVSMGLNSMGNYIPGRNLFFISLAALYAIRNNIPNIVIGVSQSDFHNFPDCQNSFVKSLNIAINLSMDYEFIIHTPLMWMNKREIWQLADEFDIIDTIKTKTMTCYNGVIEGCGICPACILRESSYSEYIKYKSKNEG